MRDDINRIKRLIKNDTEVELRSEDYLIILNELKRTRPMYYKQNILHGISRIDIKVEDGYLGFTYETTPVNRIRRITGYLVGDTSRWNNAKRDELKHRVKHIE